jgi:hypothetical protein
MEALERLDADFAGMVALHLMMTRRRKPFDLLETWPNLRAKDDQHT